jgi:hypothetical protein
MPQTQNNPAPSVVPTVEITVGGQTRHLKYDFAALAAYEQVSGESALSNIWRGMTLRRVVHLLYAGLVHETPTLTLEEVQGWFNRPRQSLLLDVTNAVVDAWTRASADDEEAEAEADAPLENATA